MWTLQQAVQSKHRKQKKLINKYDQMIIDDDDDLTANPLTVYMLC